MAMFTSHRTSILLFGCALIACGTKSSSVAVFESSRKLDGRDAPNGNGTVNIWRVNFDGTGLMPLTKATAAGASSSAPQWSPDGSKVVFTSQRKLDGSDALNANGTNNIWRVNADGTGLTPLTTATGAPSGNPQWSPDGSQVVFESFRNIDGSDAWGSRNIWRVNADGTGLKPLTTTTAEGAHWSPDGSKIVFQSTANGTTNIWRLNADGTGLRPLTTATTAGASSSSPHWSPDGS